MRPNSQLAAPVTHHYDPVSGRVPQNHGRTAAPRPLVALRNFRRPQLRTKSSHPIPLVSDAGYGCYPRRSAGTMGRAVGGNRSAGGAGPASASPWQRRLRPPHPTGCRSMLPPTTVTSGPRSTWPRSQAWNVACTGFRETRAWRCVQYARRSWNSTERPTTRYADVRDK